MTNKILAVFISAALLTPPAFAAKKDAKKSAQASKTAQAVGFFKPTQKITTGSVIIGKKRIDYQAVAGTLVVHPKGYDDVLPPKDSKAFKNEIKTPQAEASIFYVAYFKKGEKPGKRPITFLYNGGPGSSSVWLHMGAFGPKRVVTLDDTHTPAAPYSLIDNRYSLLDASDLVFIDAPGTGFSRIAGKDAAKSFWGVDQDAHAFAEFIKLFLSQYGRWNSPKYLFGESYGTTRSAVLVDEMENDEAIDFNGVILLSQILNFDLSIDGPESNPSVDLPYELGLPTYAATAWFHHKLPAQPKNLDGLIKEVENFSMTEYAQALAKGLTLSPKEKDAVAAKLHNYTGLPVSYIKKANLRIDGGEFEKNLEDAEGMTTGRLDTRFSGPTLDPLSKEASYDPQSAAISSAYVSVFNDYVRKTLQYGANEIFKPEINIPHWDFRHQGNPQTTNVMPDLADAMKQNPNLKILLNAGYFDLATPFYEGIYEMRHLQIPQKLFSNISFHFYQSGHMVYAHEPSLKDLHQTVSDFIKKTDNLK